MKHLFDAANQSEEDYLLNLVETTINFMRFQVEQDGSSVIELRGDSVDLIATLIDMGTAPNFILLPSVMRQSFAKSQFARLQLTEECAMILADHIELGLARHQAGCTDPYTFILH